MIRLHNHSVALGRHPVLHNVSFTAAPGEFAAICGPNGAGKTTLLRALAGLLPGGRPRPREIAYLPQGASCAWSLTIRQVAALGRIPHNDSNAHAIEAALRACGIHHLAHRPIDQVSGGQARRAMLARAWATQPQMLLLDEPIADLDPAAAHEIMALLAGFAAAGGIVVAVLHALDLAARYAGRMVVMDQGRIVADSSPARALPAAAAAFGMDLRDGMLEPRKVGWGEAAPPKPPGETLIPSTFTAFTILQGGL
jgi:iron complex transport system ATP-binding protein